MHVVIRTSLGPITLALAADKTPKTVENFLQYVENGFYSGTIFHRVIPNFMIQGGGFQAGLTPTESMDPIENEADLGLSNKTGTIAMARTNDPHSATSQFFINVNDNLFLDFKSKTPQGWGYCAFGTVTEGMDIVHSIAKQATGSLQGHQDVPLETILIEGVEILAEA